MVPGQWPLREPQAGEILSAASSSQPYTLQLLHHPHQRPNHQQVLLSCPNGTEVLPIKLLLNQQVLLSCPNQIMSLGSSSLVLVQNTHTHAQSATESELKYY
jgi:hypothetical protein